MKKQKFQVKQSHTDLIQHVKVLFKKNWPSEINIRYGEESVSNLCELFRLPEKRRYMTAFQEYVDTGIPPRDLNPLLQAVNSIPVSTAECERAFSTMNIIMTDRRNSIPIERASALTFISSVGPPLNEFNPE